MAACPSDPAFLTTPGYYFLFVLAVTLNSLLMMIIGGWIKNRMQKGGLRFRFANKSRFRKKLTGFFLFIIAIFLLGWMGKQLQDSLYGTLCKSLASNIIGIIIAVLIAWFLYDWLVWRKNNEND